MGWIILIVCLLLVLFIISLYNNLVKLRQRVRNAWSQIDVQLVNTVKGYMNHEEGTLTKIAELRTSWANSTTVTEKAELDNQLSGALKTIMAVSESYPDLKANTNFVELQEELKATEDKLAFARQFYNDTVTMYNTKLEVVPSNIVASLFGFKAEALFKTDSSEAKQNVKVDFND